MENKEKSQNIINNVDKENTIIPSQFKRVEILLADGLYDKADEVLERFLDTDPTNSKAYLYKLLVELKLSSINQLIKYDKPIDTYYNYKKAYEYGNLEEQEILNSINESIKTNIANKRLSTIYDNAIRLKNEKKYDLAIDLFNVILEYKDSLNQTKECQDLKQQSIYSGAKKMMESKKYAKAIEMFNKISDYDDASIQIDKCIELIAIEKKESIYKKCVFNRELTIKDYSMVLEAYNNLKTISDYKDAKELLTKYKELLEEFDVQKKKRKKKAKRISAIASGSIVGVSAITLLMIFVIVPFARYSIAQNLLDSNPQKAIKYFEKSEWKDYSKQIELAKARIYFNNAAFSDGIKQICDNGGSVTINYNTNGGSEIESQEVTHFSDYIVEETTKDSDTFYKWSIDSISYKKNNYDVDLTLKANWLNDYCEFVPNNDGSLALKEFTLDDSAFTSFNIPEIIDGKKVTSIKSNAFINSGRLKEVVIPDTVTSIDDDAFKGCNNLTIYSAHDSKPEGWSENWNKYHRPVIWNVREINNYLSYQYWVRGTKDNPYVAISGFNGGDIKIELPSIINEMQVYEIADNAFLDETYLKQITMPDCIKYIGNNAFSGCTSLLSIEIPNNVETIGYGAFYNCLALKSITIPTHITEIKDYSFYNCNLLKSLKIPSNVTKIGKYAFANNSNLEAVVIPDSVAIIKESAFAGCNKITIYSAFNDLPSGWEIGWKPFATIVYWDVLDIGTYDSYSYLIKGNKNDKYIEITGYKEFFSIVYIPDEIDNIPVKVIGKKAFSNTSKSVMIVIPEGVETICENAFDSSKSIKIILIPESITKIESFAFSNCDNLTIYCASNEKPNSWDENWNYSNYKVNWNVRDIGSTGEYEYWVRGTKNDPYIVLKKYNNSASTINIPSEINFTPVKEIGDRCFYEHTEITKVINLDNITSIGDEAFYGCRNLDYVSFIDDVIYMGEKAFYNNGYDTVIYCSVESAPITWSDNWCDRSNKVIWNIRGMDSTEYFTYWIRGSKEDSYISIRKYIGSDLNVTIPYEIAQLEVREIGEEAFLNNIDIKSVIMPDSITKMENRVFYNCSDLSSITLSENLLEISNEAFGYCVSLTSINLPDSLTLIGENAFVNCSRLEKINIPNKVTEIKNYAFSNCGFLRQIMIPNNVLIMGYRVFYNCSYDLVVYCNNESQPTGWQNYWTGSNAKIIWNVSGYGTSQMFDYANIGQLEDNKIAIVNYKGTATSVEIPSTLDNYVVTEIGCKAFYNKKLEEIVLPNTIEKIDEYAFSNAKKLKSIKLPNSLKKLCSNAFYLCESLETVEIPKNVLVIGDTAFYGAYNAVIYCEAESKPSGWSDNWNASRDVIWNVNKHENYESLEYVIIGNQDDKYIIIIKYYGEETNLIIPFSINDEPVKEIRKNAFQKNTYLENVELPNGILSIGEYAFSNCSSLKSITIPDSVTSIGKYAFESCVSLESIALPNGMTTIEQYSFINCTSLKSVTIGENITTIKNGAFQSCEALATIKLPRSVTTLYDGVFSGCKALNKIFLPKTLTTIYGSPFKKCTINVYCEASLKPTDWSDNWNQSGKIQYVFGATEDQM